MAAQKTKDEGRRTEAPEATLDDVLGAVQGVGKRVDALDNKVSSIDRRVTSLEKSPGLKTRIVHQVQGANGTAKAVQAEPPTARTPVRPPADVRHDDEGEDEAIASGNWEKVVKRSRCYRIDVTKVRSPQFADCWKLLLRMRGQRRPAVICGFDGTQELIEMMREVWPSVNEDIFDEALFEERWAERRQADPKAPMPIVYSEDVLFEVDWFRTAPNYRGHTFINVEGLYPIIE
jgi:hypothetical protein